MTSAWVEALVGVGDHSIIQCNGAGQDLFSTQVSVG